MKFEKDPTRSFQGIWIPSELWLSEDLTLQEKCLVSEIHSLDNGKQHCNASNAYLSKFFGITERHLQRILKKTESLGLIEIEIYEGYKRNLKSTLNQWVAKKNEDSNNYGGGDIDVGGGCHRCHPYNKEDNKRKDDDEKASPKEKKAKEDIERNRALLTDSNIPLGNNNIILLSIDYEYNDLKEAICKFNMDIQGKNPRKIKSFLALFKHGLKECIRIRQYLENSL